MASLEPRLRRHLEGCPEGKCRWHVDYLSPLAGDKQFRVLLLMARMECELNRAAGSLQGARVLVPGFGSSDCRCRSHLHYTGAARWPAFPGLTAWPVSSTAGA
ncbi:MAG: hypothetical protein A3F83_11045 [Candidatus Glassbacteria bacterium RIFCSPLOWO2_12_FULL_58_11]|uniref:GIY-YIG domain-containing protein n=1 Tax=Candidatus Glassbacteria bacterium RIFCSPLOWO2_12_FULL_58_11 TaxID=1817867 RepID=A0A1F5YWR2_9BACT|nr:MAG: hypothetical protein A3F83_11045 [Candidatus Glassbacteria bacterium RIFCSPLOWO2_12_FULL_58_11]